MIYILVVYITALGVGGATVIGGLIGFLLEKFTEKHSKIIMSFAAGVMLSTSVFNLILPSAYSGDLKSLILSVFGVFSGAFCVSFLEKAVKKSTAKLSINNNEKINKILLFVAAIAIHNFPEGIAAGVGFGTGNISDALIVAGSIALQNIPEGMVVIAPMLSVGISRLKTFLIAVVTAVSEIAGTLFGYFAVTISNEILPFALSFAGGTMLYVICSDMIPESQSITNKNKVSYSLIIGFSLMIIIDNIIN